MLLSLKKFTVSVFFTVSVKMPKIELFHVTKPKNEVFSVIEVPPFRPSSSSVLFFFCQADSLSESEDELSAPKHNV